MSRSACGRRRCCDRGCIRGRLLPGPEYRKAVGRQDRRRSVQSFLTSAQQPPHERIDGLLHRCAFPAEPGSGQTLTGAVGVQRFFSSASSSISKYVLYAFMRFAKPNMGMRSKALQSVLL
jgi:hypothetical protein